MKELIYARMERLVAQESELTNKKRQLQDLLDAHPNEPMNWLVDLIADIQNTLDETNHCLLVLAKAYTCF
jgi:hypothetical protein